MSQKVAPWLQGLNEGGWDFTAPPAVNNVSSASHDAGSIRSNGSRSRLPRRSLSGLPSSIPSQTTSSKASTQIKRSPLAPLNNTNSNTLRKPNGTTKMAGTRSVSEMSDGSDLQCGTVHYRSKSASPAKKQETLEWKRRLVKGEVGYGDQTDLFGPSGLENIFAKSKGPENEAPKTRSRMHWLQKSDAPMPSSPPPWPSSNRQTTQPDAQQRHVTDSSMSLNPVDEEDHEEQDEEDKSPSLLEEAEEAEVEDDSFGSNPFDLRNTDELEAERHSIVHSPDRDDSYDELVQDGKGANRTVSGQTELEQEDFSPVFISKHTTVNGQVNYAALDSHLVKQFNSVRVNLRHPSQEEGQDPTEEDDTADAAAVEHSAFTDGPNSDSLPVAPDLSLSENLPTGTPPVADLGRHVEFRRGGYSAYGSFKQRPLSPSPSKTEESTYPNRKELLSPIPASPQKLPAEPTLSQAPTTPLRPRTPDPPKSRSSGSPLKLFGAHDTFTNNRLLRRISQLDPEESASKAGEPTDQIPHPRERQISQAHSQQSFGSGGLDDHAFNAEITITSASDSSKADSDRSPGPEIPVPGSKDPFAFRPETPFESRDGLRLQRRSSRRSVADSGPSALNRNRSVRSTHQPTVEDVSEFDAYYHRAEQVKAYDGGSKRPPTSPFKNPTPKRRRTLHASELEDELAQMNRSYRSQMSEAASSMGRKGVFAGELHTTADPAVLANRKILRPRNPTPSQRRKQQIEAELREAAEEFAAQEPEQLEAVLEQIENSMDGSDGPPTLQQQAEVVATEVANFTLRVQKPSGEHGQRKRSVTTQDFLNEAMMVMQLIRAKARPQSGLGSVEESDAEGLSQSLRPDGSTRTSGESLRISRPPSREGRHSGWRTAVNPQTDARVVSHLRKFQERDDTEFIADSIRSLRVAEEESLNDNVVVVDEHSNIRIYGPRVGHDQEESNESRPQSQRSEGSTLNTQQSGGTSTGRTIGTSSTRKSENVGTLAPDAVAHLIGEQVGAMTFDKDKQRWVRVKSPERPTGFLEPPSQLTSDDDPFREISDLPVDELSELRRISGQGGVPTPISEPTEVASHDHTMQDGTTHQPTVESRTSSNETVITQRPVTRDSSHMQTRIHHMHSSSVPSRHTALASSQQGEKVETRATSWSDEELAKLSAMGRSGQQPLAYAAAEATLALRGVGTEAARPHYDEVSEIALPSPPVHRTLPTRSAPVQAIGSNNMESVRLGGLRNDAAMDLEESDVEDIASPKLRKPPATLSFAPPTSYPSRQMSVRTKTLASRFNADGREQSELSLVAALPGERMMSLSLSVSRPLSVRRNLDRQITDLQPSPSEADPNGTFLLSDLPDFTIHEEDEEKPSERALATRLVQHAAAKVDDRYTVAVQQLVKTLTDVQEDEPYWEDVKQLDLHDRSLASLYGLDDFCIRVQEMDVSNNALTQFQGAPTTIRKLIARSNQLSSLTCWARLTNLQYLDISHNHIDSLAGLGHLVHLRELRADGNQITNLEGVMELDGLLKLRLRDNSIQGTVDFTGSQLHRLTDLDLGDNQIETIQLEGLKMLGHLRLDHNPLESSPLIEHPLTSLMDLSLADCGLRSLDVAMYPYLRTLNVDDNALAGVEGLDHLKCLETLSMRRQTLPPGKTISIFDDAFEARVVRLSGNTMSTLALSTSFLGLQHLELASVGLQELPTDFGLRMPNLRSLNLNFNALKDIRPLCNIQKLEQLSICGNRLARLRKSVATLARFVGLRTLDLRDNPVTHGFYPPSVTAQTSILQRVQSAQFPGEDEHAEALELAKGSLPQGNNEQDRQHQGRLDEETRLRRRVYELLLAHSCHALETVDGLHFEKTSADVKDDIWQRLVELGVLRKSSTGRCMSGSPES